MDKVIVASGREGRMSMRSRVRAGLLVATDSIHKVVSRQVRS